MGTYKEFQPAEVFPAGEYLRDELEERGWTVSDFAEILGRPTQAISEILNGRKSITVTTANEIADATGTSAETWLRLQENYNLWKFRQDNPNPAISEVARRAKLAEILPIAELKKRGIVPESGIDAQESAVLRFLRIDSLDQRPSFRIAARRSDEGQPLSALQVAWLACVRDHAERMRVPQFDIDALSTFATNLTRIIVQPRDLRLLPERLAETGVRLVHIEAFKGSKIDGASWKDERGPIIGISARLQGLDSIVFTLLHEIAHITLGHVDDGIAIDSGEGSEQDNGREEDANNLAATWAIPRRLELPPRISRSSVEKFSSELGIHPAIVVGRLHHTGKLSWSHLNQLVPKVREYVSEWS